ncbi:hypothetical protein [Limnochorda pilosa]|uniref:Rhodanese domain-containing protein n=1 Tax=Limnochorda pilosa TaxID=1555112 RepID=A0A0K2SKQ1_LIMPI|nr:hypothetical protein [Limnochorda pilosa]BAS27602.1 hypothetical protein LIP_1756 [Limnochorda pilosa]
MAVAIGVIHGEVRARRVFEQLRLEGFGPSQISMRFLSREELPGFPETYDPVGGARFFGTPVVSLPAAGYNLVGNSTTLDTSITTLSDLLSTMAAMERQPADPDQPQVRLLIQVRGQGAERAAAILREAGAHPVRLEWGEPVEEIVPGAVDPGDLDQDS